MESASDAQQEIAVIAFLVGLNVGLLLAQLLILV